MFDLVVNHRPEKALYYWAVDIPEEVTSSGTKTVTYYVERDKCIYPAGARLNKYINDFISGTLDHLALEILDSVKKNIFCHINETPPGYKYETQIPFISDDGFKLMYITSRKINHYELIKLRKILKMPIPVPV